MPRRIINPVGTALILQLTGFSSQHLDAKILLHFNSFSSC